MKEFEEFEKWWILEGQNIVGHYDHKEEDLARLVWEAANEYEHICETPTGYGLFRRKNEAGGYTYITDELGAIIWDTCLVAECDLLCTIVQEHFRKFQEINQK